MSEEESTTKFADGMWALRCETLFHVQVQLRYHRRRQRFFDLADKLTKSVTVVLGATMIGQSLKDYSPYVGSGVTALGLFALVFGYGDRKQLHKELSEQAAGLVSEIFRVPASQLDETHVAAFAVGRANLLNKSPPPLRALTVICEHEQSIADGHPEHISLPCFCRRFIADFVS